MWRPCDPDELGNPEVLSELEAAHDESIHSVIPPRYDAYGRLASLPVGEELDALSELLTRHTTTPAHCSFLAWEGLHMGMPHLDSPATLDLQDRPHHAFRGAATDLADLAEHLGTLGMAERLGIAEIPHQTRRNSAMVPSFWWPDDLAWFAGWHIDAAYVVLGGSEDLLTDLASSNQIGVRRLPANAELEFDH
ncbi:hypothetical protein [Nocardioides sp. AE5]|uniref:hypothetical protein n=1 Tax=Nocardioides sp. AE5 TaxID=2962573 RepID=UPI002882149C|nr:hypothetical protein [Nocardioides sp. AE5]MDT0201627.1 hypothetical protein [Nocardioides sp. AE5]